MIKDENKVLLEQLDHVKEVVCSLDKKKLLDDSVYNWSVWTDESIHQQDPLVAMQDYYREILEKMNLSAVSLLIRTIEWAKGFFDAIEADNWLTAAASLRGAMESAGDARISLKKCIGFLFEEKTHIEEWLLCDGSNMPKKLYAYEEMENLLNEFIFANRKQDNARRGEPYLPEAKQNKDYIESLGEIDGPEGINTYKLYYAQLCELTHPSGIPIRKMYDQKDGTIRKNDQYSMFGMAELVQWASVMSQRVFINPINLSLCLMRILAVMNVNPRNKIHKGIDLTAIFENNAVLKQALVVFGKENINRAGL